MYIICCHLEDQKMEEVILSSVLSPMMLCLHIGIGYGQQGRSILFKSFTGHWIGLTGTPQYISGCGGSDWARGELCKYRLESSGKCVILHHP